MKTIDNDPEDFTLTFAADYWIPYNDECDKSSFRKKRIEKILSNLNEEKRIKETVL